MGESYGEIKLRRFCILATLAHKLGWKMYLSLQVFYLRNNTVTFVATKNKQSLIRAVKEKYTDAVDISEISILCDYTTKAISFTIPTEPQAGWEILPTFKPPQILTRIIRKYRPRETPPAIEVKTKWIGEGEPKEEYCMSCSSPVYYANARARKLATPGVVAVTRGAVSSRSNTG